MIGCIKFLTSLLPDYSHRKKLEPNFRVYYQKLIISVKETSLRIPVKTFSKLFHCDLRNKPVRPGHKFQVISSRITLNFTSGAIFGNTSWCFFFRGIIKFYCFRVQEKKDKNCGILIVLSVQFKHTIMKRCSVIL